MRRPRLLNLLLLFAFFAVSACSQPTLSHEEVTKLIGEGAVLVDVRTQGEFDSGHLKGAVHLPHDRISELPDKVDLKKESSIVLYCRSGGRAGRAKASLEKLGYKNVVNGGGFVDLSEAGAKVAE